MPTDPTLIPQGSDHPQSLLFKMAKALQAGGGGGGGGVQLNDAGRLPQEVLPFDVEIASKGMQPARTPNLVIIGYQYPTDGGGNLNTMYLGATLAAREVGTVFIANPSTDGTGDYANSPMTPTSPNGLVHWGVWSYGLTELKKAGVRVLVYVPTGYGFDPTDPLKPGWVVGRTVAQVKSYIDRVREHYSDWASGIFLDEFSNKDDGAGNADPAMLARYQEIYDYCKTKGFELVIANHGTSAPEGYLSACDVTMLHENASSISGTPRYSYVDKYSSSRFGAITFGEPTEAGMKAEIDRMCNLNVGYVWVTDDQLPNPYDATPSYLAAMIRHVRNWPGQMAEVLDLVGDFTGTGVYDVGGITIDSADTITISGVRAIFSAPGQEPDILDRHFPDVVVTLTNIATSDLTFIGINEAGQVFQQTAPFTTAQRALVCPLATVEHINRTSISFASLAPANVKATSNRFESYVRANGILNIDGNVISANGANMMLNRSAGSMWGQSINYGNSKSAPDEKTQPAATPLNFFKALRTGPVGALTTLVDPNIWDNNGVPTAVPNGDFTVQRVYVNPDGYAAVAYGQATYTTLARAVDGISTEQFVRPNFVNTVTLRAYLIVKKGTTNLSNAADAAIANVAGLGGTAGGPAFDAGAVRYDVETGLSEAQKRIARGNVGTNRDAQDGGVYCGTNGTIGGFVIPTGATFEVHAKVESNGSAMSGTLFTFSTAGAPVNISVNHANFTAGSTWRGLSVTGGTVTFLSDGVVTGTSAAGTGPYALTNFANALNNTYVRECHYFTTALSVAQRSHLMRYGTFDWVVFPVAAQPRASWKPDKLAVDGGILRWYDATTNKYNATVGSAVAVALQPWVADTGIVKSVANGSILVADASGVGTAGNYSLSIGGTDNASQSTLLGTATNVNAGSNFSVVVGRNAHTGDNAQYGTALGYAAYCYAFCEGATAVGANSGARAASVAVGKNAQGGNNAVAIGESADCGSGDYSVLVGKSAVAWNGGCVAIGYNTGAEAGAVVIGSDAKAYGDGAVVIGTGLGNSYPGSTTVGYADTANARFAGFAVRGGSGNHHAYFPMGLRSGAPSTPFSDAFAATGDFSYSDLPAGHVTLGHNGSGAVTLYFNDNGTVRSLALGTLS